MPGLFFKSTERNLGPIVHWGCPRCETDRSYHLLVKYGSFSFLGFGGIKSGDLLDARCEICDFEIAVQAMDSELLPLLHQHTASFLEGKLNRKEYWEMLTRINCQLIRDLQALSDEWECPSCGEVSPVSFSQCWQCGQVRDGAALEPGDDSGQGIEDLDVGGHHPWEK